MVRKSLRDYSYLFPNIDPVLPRGFLLCSPFGDGTSFRQTCQRYYFPINGYSASDFIITNGGLIGIIGLATAEQLQAHGIDPETAAEIIEMCSNNVSVTIAKLSIFLEPRIANIECLLFGVRQTLKLEQRASALTPAFFIGPNCDSGIRP